jgi:hypothetical protein
MLCVNFSAITVKCFFPLIGKYGCLFDAVVKQELICTHEIKSPMLFLYMNGMFTTPNEIRNTYEVQNSFCDKVCRISRNWKCTMVVL